MEAQENKIEPMEVLRKALNEKEKQIEELKQQLKWYQDHYQKLLETVGPLIHFVYEPCGRISFKLAPLIKNLLYPEENNRTIKTYKIF